MTRLSVIEVLATGRELRRANGRFGAVRFKLRNRATNAIFVSAIIPKEVPIGAFRFEGRETADVKVEFVRTGRVVTFNFTGWTVTAAVRRLAGVTDTQEMARITAPFTGAVMDISLDT
jgi:nucleoside diphosphate kinase